MTDFICTDHGSIFLLEPRTPEAKAWIDEHVVGEVQMFGNAIAVGRRFIGDLLRGITGDGLGVE